MDFCNKKRNNAEVTTTTVIATIFAFAITMITSSRIAASPSHYFSAATFPSRSSVAFVVVILSIRGGYSVAVAGNAIVMQIDAMKRMRTRFG